MLKLSILARVRSPQARGNPGEQYHRNRREFELQGPLEADAEPSLSEWGTWSHSGRSSPGVCSREQPRTRSSGLGPRTPQPAVPAHRQVAQGAPPGFLVRQRLCSNVVFEAVAQRGEEERSHMLAPVPLRAQARVLHGCRVRILSLPERSWKWW